MKINRELLEKYHLNQCSKEEADAVEAWLFSGDSEEALQLPAQESKDRHKAQMWNAIAQSLPADVPVSKRNSFFNLSFWSGAVAAVLLTCIMAITIYQLKIKARVQDIPFVAVNNTSSEHVRYFEASGYHIAVGTNTSTKINNETGIIDLSGSLLIRPKKDIQLLFKGSKEKMVFKSGQTYILLKGEDGNDKILVVNEKNVMDLPPVLQKQILNEFEI